MTQDKIVALGEICTHHQIEISFIHSLHEIGLIEVFTIENINFIARDSLPQLEKYISFHYAFGINLEGIESINHLLQRINDLQEEVLTLKNRLQFYESSD